MNFLQKAATGLAVGLVLGMGFYGYKFSHPPTRSFAPFVGVTRIKVFDAQGNATVINDPSRIARICTFVNRYANQWGATEDLLGVPLPGVKADFSAGPVFLGHFGVGANFFETQRDGDFASHSASVSEVSTFCRLVGVTKP